MSIKTQFLTHLNSESSVYISDVTKVEEPISCPNVSMSSYSTNIENNTTPIFESIAEEISAEPLQSIVVETGKYMTLTQGIFVLFLIIITVFCFGFILISFEIYASKYYPIIYSRNRPKNLCLFLITCFYCY